MNFPFYVVGKEEISLEKSVESQDILLKIAEELFGKIKSTHGTSFDLVSSNELRFRIGLLGAIAKGFYPLSCIDKGTINVTVDSNSQLVLSYKMSFLRAIILYLVLTLVASLLSYIYGNFEGIYFWILAYPIIITLGYLMNNLIVCLLLRSTIKKSMYDLSVGAQQLEVKRNN